MSAPLPAFDREAVIAAVRPEIEAFAATATPALRSLLLTPALVFGFAIAGFVLFSFIGLPGLGGFLGFCVGVGIMFRSVFKLFAPAMRARAEAMRLAAPHLGLDYAFKLDRPVDVSAFQGTAYSPKLEYVHVENVLSGTRGEARFQLFDLVSRPGKNKPGPDRPGGLSFPFLNVARVEIPGRWTARTVIARDYGVANRLSKPRGLDPVRLVDPAFERTFEVWSSDQTEARALLHPVFMERLKALEDRFHPKGGEDAPPPALAVFQDGAFLLGVPAFAYAPRPEEAEAARENPLKALKAVQTAKVAELAVERLVDDLAALIGVVDALLGRE